MPTEPTDDELELIRESGAVLRAGRLSLAAGTGSYRVKTSMARVARALGIERHEAHVTLTEITATSHRGASFRTEVAEVRTIGINAARLSAIELAVTAMERSGRRWSVDEVNAELDRIDRIGALYPTLLNALWSAIACGGFSFLVGGWGYEILGAALGAGFGQLTRRLLLQRKVNQYGGTMLAAAVACLVYLLFVRLLQAAGAGQGGQESGYVAAVLFLVPGFPFVTGALDLAKSDFSAGIARLTYAFMVLLSAAMAVWAFSSLAGFVPGPLAAHALPPLLRVVLRLAASFAGVMGFALMFNSPWRMALAAAITGMIANTLRLELVLGGLSAAAAAAIGALLVGLVAAYLAPRLHVPRITVSVPAVVIMVPGAVAYRSVYHLANGDTVQAMSYGFEAVLVVGAIAIGLGIARMLTDRTWAFDG